MRLRNYLKEKGISENEYLKLVINEGEVQVNELINKIEERKTDENVMDTIEMVIGDKPDFIRKYLAGVADRFKLDNII